jgi:hypothetical protein
VVKQRERRGKKEKKEKKESKACFVGSMRSPKLALSGKKEN